MGWDGPLGCLPSSRRLWCSDNYIGVEGTTLHGYLLATTEERYSADHVLSIQLLICLHQNVHLPTWPFVICYRRLLFILASTAICTPTVTSADVSLTKTTIIVNFKGMENVSDDPICDGRCSQFLLLVMGTPVYSDKWGGRGEVMERSYWW